MLSLYYHELIGNIEEYEGKKYLMIDDNILDKVLEKIIAIKKYVDTKNLIDTDDKLPDEINLKNIVI